MPQQEQRVDWRKDKVQLELLARFFRGADPWSFIGKEHWTDVLGRKVEVVVEELREAGALVAAPVELKLASRYSEADLQYLLVECGLATDGGRDALIARLINEAGDEARRLADEINTQVLSEEAKKHVIRYARSERERRETAERKSLVAIIQKEYLRAALLVGEFQQNCVFSRGVGVAIGDEDHTENVEIVRGICERLPVRLQHLSREALDMLRPAAAMAFLWGRESAATWIRSDVPVDVPEQPEVLGAMLQSHGRYLAQVERSRTSANKAFEIWCAHDSESCAACRDAAGEPHTLDSLPELPHAECTSPLGCRCRMVPSQQIV